MYMRKGEIHTSPSTIPVNITPTMTGYNTPSGYNAFASSELAGNPYYAWNAFNDATTIWHSDGGAPHMIGLKFPRKVKVSQFSIRHHDAGGATQFDLQGSNDGVNFTTVQSYTNAGTPLQTFMFYVDKPMTFQYFRLKINATTYSIGGNVYAIESSIIFYGKEVS